MPVRFPVVALCLGLVSAVPSFSQQMTAKFDLKVVQTGKVEFKSSCGFCHGDDATGSRAPDLIRSALLNHDLDGNLIGPVIRNGRPDKGMPAFPNLKETQVSAIVTFLHSQAYEALHSAHVPGDYPLKKLLTGNADAGKAYFEGAGGCASCHSASGDLAKIASKYRPIDLQQRFVYPMGEAKQTATVVLLDGQRFEGVVKSVDEFQIAIETKDGWYHSWPLDIVKFTIKDPLEAHRQLTEKYTDADIHNLFAYLETLK